jgi:hypothetical protein
MYYFQEVTSPKREYILIISMIIRISKMKKNFFIILLIVTIIIACKDDKTTKPVIENHSPEAPSNPTPINNAVEVYLEPTISWVCSDQDNDYLTYDVYFGDTPDPVLVSENQEENYYDVLLLTQDKTYYWKVVSKDSHNLYCESPLWTFRTVNTADTYLLEDDFESYIIGSFPTTSEWLLHENGISPLDQYVSSLQSDSGMKSMRISGTSFWRAEMKYPIDVQSTDYLGFEISFFANPLDPGGRCGFYSDSYGEWGELIHAVSFNDNFVIFAGDVLCEFDVNTWVRVKFDYLQSEDKVNLWVNGEKLVDNLEVEDNEIPISSFYIGTRFGAGPCVNYWDDVSVYIK